MTEIGPWALIDPMAQVGDLVLRNNMQSEKLAEDIDKSVKTIVDEAYEIAKMHIKNHCVAIDSLVEILMEKETLNGDEFRALLSEFTYIYQNPIVNKLWLWI